MAMPSAKSVSIAGLSRERMRRAPAVARRSPRAPRAAFSPVRSFRLARPRVIPQELVTRDGDKLRINEWPDALFVRARGHEALRGDRVLAAGVRLGPVEIAVLATVGCRDIPVVRRPSVFRLGTGDEVVSPDEPLPVGKIRDSNGDLIEGLLRREGLSLFGQARVSDDRDSTFAAIREAADACDFLLVSGGASVGDHDHARPALEAAGFAFLAHGLHLRPGRPVGIARRGAQWAVALPGNPLSHLVILRLLIVPLLRACSGETDVEPHLLRGTLAGDINDAAPKRDTFWPAVITIRDGALSAQPGRFFSSGDLIGTVGINGFINLPVGQPVARIGESVDILPLSQHFP